MIERAVFKRLRPSAVIFGVALCIAGCSSSDDGPKATGTRIPVLAQGPSLTADAQVAGSQVNVSPAFRNTEWAQAGGVPSHAMYHLDASTDPKVAWTLDIGAGDSRSKRLVSTPVITLDSIYAMDADGVVRAFSLENRSVTWKTDLRPEDFEADVGFLGGLAFANGRIYAATGFGQVVALDAATGKEIWRKTIGIPFRNPPTVDGGRVFATTQDNQIYALSADTGETQWNYVGLQEAAGYLGGASPAVSGEVVVAPFSSGEIVALRVENGRSVWQASLTPSGRTGSLGTINDIRGQVVIDRGMVLAASSGGFVVGVDLRSGDRRWEREFGSSNTPWVGGDAVFAQSDAGELTALTRDKGLIYWVTQLPKFEDEEDKSDPIVWYGPVLAADRLFLSGSNSKLLIVAPGNGQVLGSVELPGKAAREPIVANGVIYVMTTNGRLVALR